MNNGDSLAGRDLAIVICPDCERPMRLLGIEWETENRDLYTYTCDDCERLDVQRVTVC